MQDGSWSFLKNRFALAISVVLLIQIVLFFPLATGENVPLAQSLKGIPQQIGNWHAVKESVPEQEILDLLRADDTLDRTYADPGQRYAVNLFMAFYKTQRAGVSPHSPKVCLPGSGWTALNSAHLAVPIAGRDEPIEINRYEVARGEQKSVVLYWYQTNRRVIADELAAKAYLMLDGLRYRRSDTAMIRVVAPVVKDDDATAQKRAVEFIQAAFNPIREFLPR